MKRVFDVLGWLGVVLVVAAFGVRFGPLARFITTAEPSPDRIGMWMAWAGLALVLIYTGSQWREIRASFRRRQTRYGAIASTSVIVVLLILVAVNYLSTRRNKRWDLTENAVNSLSEQTEKVLGGLDAPMTLVLFDQSLNFDRHRERLTQYDYASDRVSIEYVDGDRDPARTKQYEVQSYPTLVVDYKERTEKVTTIDEREITGAVIRAVTGQQRKLYFVQGHGEKDPSGTDGAGYAGIAGLLTGDNIIVEPLVLTQHKDVPDDATVLAITGPTADFLDTEMEALRRYLDRGGRLLMMLDPAIGDRDQPLPKLTALAKEWGIEVGNDVVLDLSGRSTTATFAVAAPPYPPHPITDGYRISTVFPLARSVAPVATPPDGRTVQRLVETAPAAWAETDVKQLRAGGQPELDPESGDKPGPVGMAATVTTTAPEPPAADAEKADAEKKEPATPPQTRIAVFGDSDFGSNAYAGTVGNADFFMNAVNWLTAQETLIAIRPREPGDSRLTITPQQVAAVWWFSVLLVPAIIVGTGVYAWSRRRRG
ncbi:MAG: GldG family protein [Vicinamibacterales bacterium]